MKKYIAAALVVSMALASGCGDDEHDHNSGDHNSHNSHNHSSSNNDEPTEQQLMACTMFEMAGEDAAAGTEEMPALLEVGSLYNVSGSGFVEFENPMDHQDSTLFVSVESPLESLSLNGMPFDIVPTAVPNPGCPSEIPGMYAIHLHEAGPLVLNVESDSSVKAMLTVGASEHSEHGEHSE